MASSSTRRQVRSFARSMCRRWISLKGEFGRRGDARIIEAIEEKIARGPEYAEGKFLLVFTDGAGKWYRKNVREAINGRHNFKAIYCIGLESSGPEGYVYTLTQFHPDTPDASISFRVRIAPDFSSWRVLRLVDQVDRVLEDEI